MVGTQPSRMPGRDSPLTSIVYTGILAAMDKGEYPPSCRLPAEAELALHYGVSRPTVRKALSRLRLDQLITSRHGSGSYVLQRTRKATPRFAAIKSIDDVQSCFAFRLALESASAALAADLHKTSDIEDIVRCHQRMEEAQTRGDRASFLENDLCFHLAIARASRNMYFANSLQQITEQLRTVMYARFHPSSSCPPEWYEQVLAEHREIIGAIEESSSANAAEAMRLHLGKARRSMFENPIER